MNLVKPQNHRDDRPPEFFSSQVEGARRFYLSLRSRSRDRLAVACGGCERCAPEYTIDRTRFPYYSLEFVARGRGRVELSGNWHDLSTGAVFAYGPRTTHRIRNDPGQPLVKYFVDFTGPEASRLLRNHSPRPGRLVHVADPGEIQGLFEDLIRHGQGGLRHSSRLCACLLECLVLRIDDSQVPAGELTSQAFTTYQRCRQHIREHFSSLKTLEQIGAQCHVRPAYLCRLFRRYDHESPYQLLLRLKMNRAAALLQVPGALVKQVADELGFGDPFHFSRAFKSVLGLSPEAFRNLR